MNAAPAQVHAVFGGKDAFSRFKVHGFMEAIKPLLVKRDINRARLCKKACSSLISIIFPIGFFDSFVI
jgi:hypothetical protein